MYMYILKNLNTSLLLLYINKTKLKPQARLQKIDIKIFNWVTLSTIPLVSNIWTSSNLHHSFIICKYVQLCAYTK